MGTSIAVCLPESAPAQPETPEPGSGHGPTGLVVEDEAAVRRLVRSIVEAAGYQIIEVSNGREALASLNNVDRADLLLTDVVITDVTGPELVSRRSALEKPIPVLFAGSQLLRRRVSEEAVNILHKPYLCRVGGGRCAWARSSGSCGRRRRPGATPACRGPAG